MKKKSITFHNYLIFALIIFGIIIVLGLAYNSKSLEGFKSFQDVENEASYNAELIEVLVTKSQQQHKYAKNEYDNANKLFQKLLSTQTMQSIDTILDSISNVRNYVAYIYKYETEAKIKYQEIKKLYEMLFASKSKSKSKSVSVVNEILKIADADLKNIVSIKEKAIKISLNARDLEQEVILYRQKNSLTFY